MFLDLTALLFVLKLSEHTEGRSFNLSHPVRSCLSWEENMQTTVFPDDCLHWDLLRFNTCSCLIYNNSQEHFTFWVKQMICQSKWYQEPSANDSTRRVFALATVGRPFSSSFLLCVAVLIGFKLLVQGAITLLCQVSLTWFTLWSLLVMIIRLPEDRVPTAADFKSSWQLQIEFWNSNFYDRIIHF